LNTFITVGSVPDREWAQWEEDAREAYPEIAAAVDRNDSLVQAPAPDLPLQWLRLKQQQGRQQQQAAYAAYVRAAELVWATQRLRASWRGAPAARPAPRRHAATGSSQSRGDPPDNDPEHPVLTGRLPRPPGQRIA
jgi:hypothetical protein